MTQGPSPGSLARASGSRPLAFAYAIGAAIALPVMDGLVKLLAARYPIAQIAWIRFAITGSAFAIIGWHTLGWRQLRANAIGLQLLRALMIALSTSAYYRGLQYMPLPESTAIVFLGPAVCAVIGYLWLAERPDPLSWTAIAVCVAGMLLIVRPGGGMFDRAALLPLLAAICFGVFLATTRALSGRDAAAVTTLYSAIGALAAFTLVAPWQDLRPPADQRDLAMMAAVGALGALGQFLTVLAYRHAPTYFIAPLTYSALPISILVGWSMFGTLPDSIALCAIALITISTAVVSLRQGRYS